MKVLVAYYTKTGNTKQVAEAIYDALGKDEKELQPISDSLDPIGYPLIYCGFPVHAHSVPVPAQTFLKRIPQDAKLALFSTHGSLKGGQLPQQAIQHALGLAKHAKVLGTFTCRGKVEDAILEQLMNRPEHKSWALEAQSAQSHPDLADLEDAKRFARGIRSK